MNRSDKIKAVSGQLNLSASTIAIIEKSPTLSSTFSNYYQDIVDKKELPFQIDSNLKDASRGYFSNAAGKSIINVGTMADSMSDGGIIELLSRELGNYINRLTREEWSIRFGQRFT